MSLLTPPVTSVPDSILCHFLAADPANADRIYRAAELVAAGHVERALTPGLWLVRSGNPTTPDACYRIANGLCDCPDTARVGAQNCKHAVACGIYRANERADAEQADPTPEEATPRCPLHGDDECDWGCPGPSLDPQTVEVEPDPEARIELTGRGYLALVPTAALPPAIGGCTRLPMSARARALYNDIYGDDPSDAA
jgi:hypothetical protein